MKEKHDITVELFSDAINFVVLKTPGRKFPGMVIQGDSLAKLFRSASEVCRLAKASGDQNLSVRQAPCARSYEIAWRSTKKCWSHGGSTCRTPARSRMKLQSRSERKERILVLLCGGKNKLSAAHVPAIAAGPAPENLGGQPHFVAVLRAQRDRHQRRPQTHAVQQADTRRR